MDMVEVELNCGQNAVSNKMHSRKSVRELDEFRELTRRETEGRQCRKLLRFFCREIGLGNRNGSTVSNVWTDFLEFHLLVETCFGSCRVGLIVSEGSNDLFSFLLLLFFGYETIWYRACCLFQLC